MFAGWGGDLSGTASPITVRLGSPGSTTNAIALFNKKAADGRIGDYGGSLGKKQDFYGHDPFVWNAGAGKAATLHVALDTATVTLTAVSAFTPSAWLTLTGAVDGAGAFIAPGSGAIAGRSNVRWRAARSPVSRRERAAVVAGRSDARVTGRTAPRLRLCCVEMRALLAIAVLIAAGPSASLACSSFDSQPSAPATADASTDAPACDHVCSATESCRGGRCLPGCPEGVVYVSPAGSDSNSGCARDAPKATIGAAIGYVKTLALIDHEVHVCRGTYRESNLHLDYPVSLRGGYECHAWVRREPFGWNNLDAATARAVPFDPTNESILDAAGGPTALDIGGVPITRAIAVDGFTINGRATGGGRAVLIHDNAAPTLSNDQISGPAAGLLAGEDTASIGVDVTSGAGPEITRCRVDGGGGGDTSPNGSIGLRIETAGRASVHDNEIDAGHGRGSAVSVVAIDLRAPTALDGPLARNAIFYGGFGSSNGAVAARGIIINGGARADVIENRIVGLKSGCAAVGPTDTCSTFAVQLVGAGSVARNRIFLGEGTQPTMHPYGVFVGDPAIEIPIANNLIDITGSVGGQAVGVHAISAGAGGYRISHNTIYGGGVPGTLALAVETANTTVDNNLILQAKTGLLTANCTEGGLRRAFPTQMRNNMFVGTTTVAVVATGTDCTVTASLATPTTAQDSIGPTATGNLARILVCDPGAPSNCTTCSGADEASCVTEVMAARPTLTDLWSAGWKLKADGPCALAKGGIALFPDVATDHYGTARTAPVSIGAEENDGACTP